MRDPKRIKRICKLLEEKWLTVPDQRLGQFLLNYVFGRNPHHPKYDSYIFFREDDITEEILDVLFGEEWYKEIEKRKNPTI